MSKMGVYILKNTIDARVYVGSSRYLIKRRINHFNQLRRGIHINQNLQMFYNEHGAGSLIFEVIEYIADTSKLIEREQFWLDSFKDKFNICPFAGDCRGRERPEEVRRKISEKQKGKIISEETRKKISEAGKGRIVSEETRRKVGLAGKGRKNTPETIAKMSAARKSYYQRKKYEKEQRSQHNL